jgi:DNA polymerase alpha-associated DNA helicase A
MSHICLMYRLLEFDNGVKLGEPLPAHKLRNGDIVKLESMSPTSDAGDLESATGSRNFTSGVVYKVSEKSVTVAFGEQEEFPEGMDSKPMKLVVLTNEISYQRMRDALKSLLDPKVSSLPHVQILLPSKSNPSKPSFMVDLGSIDREKAKDALYDQSLNGSQLEAILFCMSAQQVSFIHGPPGKLSLLMVWVVSQDFHTFS